MTLEFQKELFRFILQDKEGRKHIQLLDASIFSSGEHQVLFDLATKYFQKYKVLPSRVSFLEHLNRSAKGLDIKPEVYKKLENGVRDLYIPYDADAGLVRESIIEFARYQRTKKMFTEFAAKLAGGQEVFKDIQKEMNKIMAIGGDESQASIVHGGSLLEDAPPSVEKIVHPCYLKAVNRMTAAGGFHSPQLVILMAAPKGFKTGNLIKMAIEYVKSGLKIYYVDMENGVDSIRNRGVQAFMECTREELSDPKNKSIYREMRGRIKTFGGDLIHDYYPSYSKTVLDVELELEALAEKGWIPDAIFWDYPDLMEPVDKSIKEKRLKPTAVYSDIIKLNVRRNTFSVGLSQVNRAALEKEVFTMQDFAEDFGKASTAHAAFAICATEWEQMAHIARIVPVMQREGQRYNGENFATVEIQEEIMSIREVSLEYATAKVEAIPKPEKKTKKQRNRRYEKDVDDN